MAVTFSHLSRQVIPESKLTFTEHARTLITDGFDPHGPSVKKSFSNAHRIEMLARDAAKLDASFNCRFSDELAHREASCPLCQIRTLYTQGVLPSE